MVDSESTDGTTELLHEWADNNKSVKVIVQKCGAARGRNIAIENARFEHIVSTDMGVRLDPLWFEKITEPFENDESVEVVMGNYQVGIDSKKSAAWRAEFYCQGMGSPYIKNEEGVYTLKKWALASNRSMALTKEVWRQLNGWPEDLTLYADDSVLGRQIKYGDFKITTAPGAFVYWNRPLKLSGYFHEMYGYGRGDGEAYIKIPRVFTWYKNGFLPRFLVPFANGLRLLTIYAHPKKLWKALNSFDLSALFLIPVLGFGKGYAFGKGFLLGYDYGNINCQDSRVRVIKLFSD